MALPDRPGAYIAHNPCFDTRGRFGPGYHFKVGHSGSLAGRLRHSAFVTCFPEPFKFMATFETGTKEEAEQIEAAILYYCRALRLGRSELVEGIPLSELKEVGKKVADALGIRITARDLPTYRKEKVLKADVEKIEAPSDSILSRTVLKISKLRIPGLSALPVAPENDKPAECRYVDPKALATSDDQINTKASIAAKNVISKPEEKKTNLTGLAECEYADPTVSGNISSKPQSKKGGALGRSLKWNPSSFVSEEEFDTLDGLPIGDSCPTCGQEIVIEDRPYQREAVESCLAELGKADRAILQVPCRCGKTKIAHTIMESYLMTGENCRIGYLVPNLGLVRQTIAKLASYGLFSQERHRLNYDDLLLVGSDTSPIDLPDSENRELTSKACMTTREGIIDAFVSAHEGRPSIIISTYQSSHLLPLGGWKLIVFDEAHRACGGREPTPFNHMLMNCNDGRRLYMTATPCYDKAVSMKDTKLFGNVAYRYYLHDAIKNRYVNPFRLEIVVAKATNEDKEGLAGPDQIATAMSRPGMDKLLVFCRDIKHAVELCGKVDAYSKNDQNGPRFDCLVAHSRMPRARICEVWRQFSTPGVRAALFNVRLFQEGVELPQLNGVLFASKRSAVVDIIQSLCRPLNYLPGKPESVIFLPAEQDTDKPITDISNIERFGNIMPVFEALASEDRRFYEFLLDPTKEYPISFVGTPSIRALMAIRRHSMTRALRRHVRDYGCADRLTNYSTIPWDIGFAALRHVVLHCNRYPKTKDELKIGEVTVNLYRYYKHLVKEYVSSQEGKACGLEFLQLRALEELPEWTRYGIHGPYIWSESIQALEEHLEQTQGAPPMLEINRGGYVGLDATPFERLSGCMTTVNQQCTVKNGLANINKVSAAKAADLDRIGKKWALRWRKEARADGKEDTSKKSWIQESQARFMAHFKTLGAESEYIRTNFPGYPRKHRFQEDPNTLIQDLPPSAPLRLRLERTGHAAEFVSDLEFDEDSCPSARRFRRF